MCYYFDNVEVNYLTFANMHTLHKYIPFLKILAKVHGQPPNKTEDQSVGFVVAIHKYISWQINRSIGVNKIICPHEWGIIK